MQNFIGPVKKELKKSEVVSFDHILENGGDQELFSTPCIYFWEKASYNPISSVLETSWIIHLAGLSKYISDRSHKVIVVYNCVIDYEISPHLFHLSVDFTVPPLPKPVK